MENHGRPWRVRAGERLASPGRCKAPDRQHRPITADAHRQTSGNDLGATAQARLRNRHRSLPALRRQASRHRKHRRADRHRADSRSPRPNERAARSSSPQPGTAPARAADLTRVSYFTGNQAPMGGSGPDQRSAHPAQAFLAGRGRFANHFESPSPAPARSLSLTSLDNRRYRHPRPPMTDHHGVFELLILFRKPSTLALLSVR